MKRIVFNTRLFLAAASLAASIAASHAGQLVISSFDTSASTTAWSFANWNGSTGSLSWSTNDAQGSASSGSMQMNVDYTTSTQGGAFLLNENNVDISSYQNLEFDVKVDPASGLDQYGIAADFKVGVQCTSSYNYHANDMNLYPTSTNNGWEHIVIPISAWGAPKSDLQDVVQVLIQCYDGNYTNSQTAVMYIDNIKFTGSSDTYPNYVGFTFDDSNDIAQVYGPTNLTGNWYGIPFSAYWSTNNSTIPNDSITSPNPNSGSLYVVANFPQGDGDNGDVAGVSFDTNYWAATPFGTEGDTNYVINGANYTNLEVDVMWDSANSTMSITNFNSIGDITGVPIGFLTDGGGQTEALGNGVAAANIPDAASNGWVHLNIPINTSTPSIGQVIGIWLKKYNGLNTTVYGTAAYWIDNIVLDGGPLTKYQPPMSISKAVPGLSIYSDGVGGNTSYTRNSIVSQANTLSFVDQPSVTYSMNIASYPGGTAYPGIGTRIFLVPTGTVSAQEAEPDWQEANVVYVQVQNNANGSGTMTMMVKTNAPNGNGSFFNAGNPSVTGASIVGNWSITIANNTSVTLTAPDGTTTNAPFPLGMTSSDVESDFGGGMEAYVGLSSNGGQNTGQGIVLKSFAFTNSADSSLNIYDDFQTDTSIDPNVWEIITDATTPGNVLFLTPPSVVYNVNWVGPASGFAVETNYDLSNTSGWATNAMFNPIDLVNNPPNPGLTHILANNNLLMLDQTNLPSSGNVFFRLVNPNDQ